MKSKISEILKDISIKKQELIKEYWKLKEKYGFSIIKWKIVFALDVKKRNKSFKQGIIKYLFSAQIRHLISAPFIYSMIIPSLLLDLFLFIFQQVCFRLYDIPFVKRSEYFDYDRRHLDYLNIIQKFNCLFCSYVNWLFSYATEVWWRTEKYWCPIKHANKNKWNHDWQHFFADYWDPEWFKDWFNKNHEFEKLKK